ncbi:autorepressor SdpR family transcription factor [Chitinophaga tropicalis]|uniref:Autorepressor SdpR family transcription factor n=1 Tax=Chitinophaga tropicalis TaxID=2683588 RepID=A0A7K1U085_9BACT|nr:autorepressor SdpR family transcription factor [Chitinophaga tropicalis]MVT07779.1 autorepressor SdpR family transcription factor [Chitinophaga tropicalis]
MNALFKALNDKTRRDILELLKSGDKTAGEIADHFQHTKPTISHHLDLLKQAELLTSEKKGQFIYYSLNTTVVDELLKWVMQFTSNSKPLPEDNKTLGYENN